MAASNQTKAGLLLLALAFIWGSSYILIKYSLEGFTAMQIGSLRMLITGLVFFPVALRKFRSWPRSHYLKFLAVGLTGTGLPAFLFPLAQGQLSSSMAGTLSSMVPLLTLLVGAIIFGRAVQHRQVLGISIGLLGALVLVSARYGWIGNAEWPVLPLFYVFLATVCYAFSSNMLKAFFPDENPISVTAGAMTPLLFFGAIGIVLSGGLPTNFAADTTLWVAYASVSFLALAGTALATWLFFKLIQLTEPVYASTVSYLVPIVALGWGILDGEIITLLTLAGLVLILSGVKLTRE